MNNWNIYYIYKSGPDALVDSFVYVGSPDEALELFKTRVLEHGDGHYSLLAEMADSLVFVSGGVAEDVTEGNPEDFL